MSPRINFALLVKQAAEQFDEPIPEEAQQEEIPQGEEPIQEEPMQSQTMGMIEEILGSDVMDAAAQGVGPAITLIAETAAAIAQRMFGGSQPAEEEVVDPAMGQAPAAPVAPAAPASNPAAEQAVADQISPAQTSEVPVEDGQDDEYASLGIDPNKTYSAEEVLELLKNKNAVN